MKLITSYTYILCRRGYGYLCATIDSGMHVVRLVVDSARDYWVVPLRCSCSCHDICVMLWEGDRQTEAPIPNHTPRRMRRWNDARTGRRCFCHSPTLALMLPLCLPYAHRRNIVRQLVVVSSHLISFFSVRHKVLDWTQYDFLRVGQPLLNCSTSAIGKFFECWQLAWIVLICWDSQLLHVIHNVTEHSQPTAACRD